MRLEMRTPASFTDWMAMVFIQTHPFLSAGTPATARVAQRSRPSPLPRQDQQDQCSATLIRAHSISQPVYQPIALSHSRGPFNLISYVPHSMASHISPHPTASLGIPISKPSRVPMQRSTCTIQYGLFSGKRSQGSLYARRTSGLPTPYKRCLKALLGGVRTSIQGVGMKVTKWECHDMVLRTRCLGWCEREQGSA
ncbi:hypothetical protein BKA70DRAFT_583339 [Coprinopsis sp. MPI-PUGE-AT-0042]|nr:hypothetical protein BKA70DRAFT_583339 [Coprinopsis sp. MPI-PUGE-AT-0042]